MDLNLWRSSYHRLIETLRRQATPPPPPSSHTANHNNNTTTASSNHHAAAADAGHYQLAFRVLSDIIKTGMDFYADLVARLEDTYLKFRAGELAELNYANTVRCIRLCVLPATNSGGVGGGVDMTIRSRSMKLALVCIHRCWISMGDLARYKELLFVADPIGGAANMAVLNGSSAAYQQQRDYSLARQFYLKAMSVAPKQSRSYHQLGVLAMYTRRRLDAFYYYFRCLEVSVPLTSVR